MKTITDGGKCILSGANSRPVMQVSMRLAVLVCMLFLATPATPQVTTGTISGVVRDSSGAVIPGVRVTATHLETGTARSTTTDATGHYVLAQLALGEHKVLAEMAAFRPSVSEGVVLTVGNEVVINIALQVGEVTEQVVVSGQAPLVEASSSSLAGLVDEKQIRELPLNGRSFDQLISLTPGTVQLGSKQRTAAIGLSAGFSVGGARWETSKFMLDGIEYIGSASISTAPSSASGKLLGVEAIREFAVVTNNADASYGKKFGGQINIVTRSGTNDYHGAVYWFLRNNHLDARNFFDQGAVPQFKQNNFGAAAGGSVRKDRTWFFANYEGYRQRLGLSNVAIVPDAEARRGVLPLPDPNRPGQRIPTVVGVAPGVVPLLPFYPDPNGTNFGDGRALAFTSPSEVVDENFLLARGDHNFSDKNSFWGRYLIDRSRIFSPRLNPHFSQLIPFRTQQTAVGLKSAMSPTMVNTLSIGFARAVSVTDVVSDLPIPPSLIFVPGQTGIGSIAVNGLDILGGAANSALLAGRYHNRNVFTYADQLNLSHGRHFFQIGGQIERIQSNEDQGTTKRGNFQFDGLLELLQGRATSFQGPFAGDNAIKGWRQTYVAMFAQDNVKVVPSLTLNLGLRYEFMTNPSEVNGRVANYDVVDGQLTNPLRTETFVGKTVFLNNKTLRGIAPRIGFAWDVRGKGKTAIRGGFGIFYNQVEDDFRRFTGANTPFFRVVQVSNVSFPQSTASLPTNALPRPLGVSRLGDVPTLLQYNIRIEQSIGHESRIAVGYVGSHAYHLSRATDPQVALPTHTTDGRWFNPLNTTRKNLDLGSTSTWILYDANSFFNSFQVEADRRLAGGLRIKGSYTFSKSIDDSSGTLGITSAQTTDLFPTDHRFDRGFSGFDVTHNFVLNWSYDLPFASMFKSTRRLLVGWQLSGILSLQSGQPFTVEDGFARSRNGTTNAADRPDLVPGASLNPILGPPQQSLIYFDPSAFSLQPVGFFGNVARNTLRGPGIASADIAIQKETRLTERFGVMFRAEAFNLLNRANFAVPASRSLFNAQGARLAAAGIITQTSTTSRQLQFGLKVIF